VDARRASPAQRQLVECGGDTPLKTALSDTPERPAYPFGASVATAYAAASAMRAWS
jgi:hypothetical protein